MQDIFPEPGPSTGGDITEPVAFELTYEEFFGYDDIPESYIPIKETSFAWSLVHLRAAINLALRSYEKEQKFRDAFKCKQSEDASPNVPGGHGYLDVRPPTSLSSTPTRRDPPEPGNVSPLDTTSP